MFLSVSYIITFPTRDRFQILPGFSMVESNETGFTGVYMLKKNV